MTAAQIIQRHDGCGVVAQIIIAKHDVKSVRALPTTARALHDTPHAVVGAKLPFCHVDPQFRCFGSAGVHPATRTARRIGNKVSNRALQGGLAHV